MDETQAIHNLNLEWGCITNLMNKISDLEDKMEGGWPELIDMVADAVTSEGQNKDPVRAFFSLYQFLFRLYYRLKACPEKRPFNMVTLETIEGKEYYRFQNYSYEAFKWVRELGQTDRVCNQWLDLAADKLTNKQRRQLNRRIGENK